MIAWVSPSAIATGELAENAMEWTASAFPALVL